MEAKTFFQDPYAQGESSLEDGNPVTIEDLAALVESVHELNAKSQELLDKKEYGDALPYLLSLMSGLRNSTIRRLRCKHCRYR